MTRLPVGKILKLGQWPIDPVLLDEVSIQKIVFINIHFKFKIALSYCNYTLFSGYN